MSTTYWSFRSGWAELRKAHGPWASGFLALLVASLVLAPNLVPLALVGSIVTLLVRHQRELGWPGRSAWRTPLPYAMLFFLWHVLAMAWTTDIDFGLFDLQIKAPLLAFPLLGLLIPQKIGRGREVLLYLFTVANALAVLLCVVAAALRLMQGSELSVQEEFFSSRFSVFLHPSYFAMYLCTALVGWLLTPVHRSVPTWVHVLVLALACMGLVLCGSKMGWILLVILLPVIMAMRWRDVAVRRSITGLLVASVLGVAGLVVVSPFARDRVQEAWRAAVASETRDDASTSSEVRRITWSAAWTLFKADPFTGTGTGDIKNELLQHYADHGQDWVLEHRLNAHSQYLQSAACLGIPGLLLLLLMVLAPLRSRGQVDGIALLFLVIVAINWVVESMLEVQAGVVFFAFFATLLGPPRPTPGRT